MSKAVQINTFEVENFKRVKAVAYDCSGKSLVVIGGKNAQGKTSLVDSLAYLFGGERYRPSDAKRDGSLVDPELRVTLSNGLVVERKGKNSALTVKDPSGQRHGQQLLAGFIPEFALNLPKFTNSNETEKANTLLKIIGIGDELERLDKDEKRLYDERHAKGQIADQKKKYADEMHSYPDAPENLVSASELIKEQQEILSRNGDNQRKRDQLERYKSDLPNVEATVARLKRELAIAENQLAELQENIATAEKTASQINDESTAEIEKRLNEIEDTNNKARANMDKQKALDDAEQFQKEYGLLTTSLEQVRKQRKDLLDGADLPLPGLAVIEGKLTYQDQNWDCMSEAEKLKVATAIVRKLSPDCGFVLVDGLERMDVETLQEFGAWCEAEGLQVIGTRVSTGGECSIIIEDGLAVTDATKPTKEFVSGQF